MGTVGMAEAPTTMAATTATTQPPPYSGSTAPVFPPTPVATERFSTASHTGGIKGTALTLSTAAALITTTTQRRMLARAETPWSGRMVAPSSRGLIGYVQARAMATGNTQRTRTTTWQANSMMQPAMMAPMIHQPTMAPMTMQAQPKQQQQTMRQPTQPMTQQ